LADPDNPPLSEEQLRRMALAREVRLVREKIGLSQKITIAHEKTKSHTG